MTIVRLLRRREGREGVARHVKRESHKRSNGISRKEKGHRFVEGSQACPPSDEYE
jgi:hypothetical protein